MNNEIEYKGARFYKCALQVNPCGYAEKHHGVQYDEDDYNQQILEQCRRNEIKVVGLADHENIDSSKTLRTCLTDAGIVVFPGFEIASTEKIHLVCLYPEDTDDSQLNQFLGQLMGRNNPQSNTPSSLGCLEIAKNIGEQGGFWYAAHIIGENGLLRLSRNGDNYSHIWKAEDLVVAAQIPGSVESLSLARNLRDIIANKNPNYKRKKRIAFINAKDVYEPNHLTEPSASCQIKMTEPTFGAFGDAFKDPELRIRLNHEPSSKPHSSIESIRWHGAGLFKNQALAFSDNLNAAIGGRGTGKSTLIESIRFVLDLEPRGDDNKTAYSIQSSNLANSQVEIKVRSGAQHGERYTISRRFGEQPVVKGHDGEISRLTPRDLLPEIDLLGQNEILNIEQSEADKLELLSKFLPDTQKFSDRIDEAKRKLSENRKRMIDARENLDALEQKINREGKLKEQRQQYKKLGIEEKLKDSTLLAKESQIAERVDDQLSRIEKWINQYEALFDLQFLQEGTIEGLPNKALISKTRAILEHLHTLLNTLLQQAAQALEKTKSEHQSTQEDWKAASNRIHDRIHQAIAQLPNQAGKSGREVGENYQRIIGELVVVERYKEEHENQQKLVAALESERRSLLEEYREAAFERYHVMQKGIEELNTERLKGKIKISVLRNKNLSALENFMRGLDGVGEQKIRWLNAVEEPIDLVEWAQWIKNGQKDNFINKYHDHGLTDSTIDRLIAMGLEKRLRLEEIELKDRVSIQLNVAHTGEKARYISMDNLSIGQKCTAILNLLLVKMNDPLIIDQPEDHLDNAFIAERIVSELRNLKNKRQVLFATHNANIPVFGDAELIVVLENDESHAVLKCMGSIDTPDIQDQAAQILEGGKAAFNMRKEKYGF